MNNFATGFGASDYVTGTPAQTPVLRPLRQPLYDREPVSTGNTSTDLFMDNKKNNLAATKTARDTNMPGSGQLATPLEFDLIGFTGHLEEGTALANFQAVYNVGVFTWLFGQTTTWLTVKLGQVPQGIASHGFFLGTAAEIAAGATLLARGWGVNTNFYNFTSPKKEARRITSNESFKNTILWPGGVTIAAGPVYWTTYMMGILYASL